MPADAPPIPPPVMMTPSEAKSLFARYPHTERSGATYAIMQFTASADPETLASAQKKLLAAGWKGDLQRTREGKTVLGIGLEDRTMQDAVVMMRRLAAGEFGKVSVETMTVPDPARK